MPRVYFPQFPMAATRDEEFVRDEKWKLLPAFLRMKGIARHHIESFNYLVDVEMKKIVEHNQRPAGPPTPRPSPASAFRGNAYEVPDDT